MKDKVVREGAAVLELLAREDQALLVRRDALLVLDLLLHVVDRVRRLDVERDGLAGEGLDENLRGGGAGRFLVARVGCFVGARSSVGAARPAAVVAEPLAAGRPARGPPRRTAVQGSARSAGSDLGRWRAAAAAAPQAR